MQQITLPVEQDKEYINCTIKLCNMTTLTSILNLDLSAKSLLWQKITISYDTCFKDLSITICQQMN